MSTPRSYSAVMAEALAANARYHELMAEAFSLSESFGDSYRLQSAEHHTQRSAEQKERSTYYAARSAQETAK